MVVRASSASLTVSSVFGPGGPTPGVPTAASKHKPVIDTCDLERKDSQRPSRGSPSSRKKPPPAPATDSQPSEPEAPAANQSDSTPSLSPSRMKTRGGRPKGGTGHSSPDKRSRTTVAQQPHTDVLLSDKLGTLVAASVERLAASPSWSEFVDQSRGRPYCTSQPMSKTSNTRQPPSSTSSANRGPLSPCRIQSGHPSNAKRSSTSVPMRPQR